MPLVVAILLGLAALALVVYPLVDTSTSRQKHLPPTATASIEAEAGAKQALRDIDFDHRLGNLDAADYIALRDRYEEHALAAMKARYDSERASDALIDEQLAALRSQSPRPTDRRSGNAATTPSASRAGASSRSAITTTNATTQAPIAAPRATPAPPGKPGLHRRRRA